MLKMNIFMFTVTLSFRKREFTDMEYKKKVEKFYNDKRISEIYEDIRSKHLDHFQGL